MQILVLLGMYFDCCGGICDQPDTFIQIGSDHTVDPLPSRRVSGVVLVLAKLKAIGIEL